MSNWGDGYREGYRNAAMWLADWLRKRGQYVDAEFADRMMDNIGKDFDGSPSQYAVANKCCGGVDAHSVGCR